MLTFGALPGGIVLEKLHQMAAFRTFFLKNGTWFPVSAVLSRAFHFFPPLINFF
jgi:hypothetical protein